MKTVDVGYVKDCILDLPQESVTGPNGYFREVVDPKSGIKYCVAFLENLRIEKI